MKLIAMAGMREPGRKMRATSNVKARQLERN